MELDEGVLRQQLTCLKAKNYTVKWTQGADATQGMCGWGTAATPSISLPSLIGHASCVGGGDAGVPTSASDIDFYIDTDPSTGKEMVIVSDTVHQRMHADFLAHHIGGWEH